MEVEAEHPDALRQIGGADFVAMPGFVDGHSHAGHGLVRNLGADDFPVWREACRYIYMDAAPLEFWQADARLSALERLKANHGQSTLPTQDRRNPAVRDRRHSIRSGRRCWDPANLHPAPAA
jgi:cytosine/adenosine deaminase-related metal-dependent hydrolase